MRTIVVVAAMVSLLGAASASSATYDAFAAFDGVGNGADGAFSFGSYDGAFTVFDQNFGCTFPNTLCYTSSAYPYYPTVVKTIDGTSYQSNTVIIPSNALVLAPGPGPNGGPSAAIQFTAPTTGLYTISASAVQIDTNINTVGVGFDLNGALKSFTLAPGGLTILSGNPASLSDHIQLTVGDHLTLLVANDGSYYSDTTQVNFTLSNGVPEPATWSFMILGFGFAGAALRRRASVPNAA